MLPYKNARAIVNPILDSVISSTIFDCARKNDDNIHLKFVETYLKWIKLTSLNTITGIDQFPILAYSNGTTESFDKFYIKHQSKRFRWFKGEYLYHQLSPHLNWKFLDDEVVSKNDAVIISLPFSDIGNEHPQMQEVLRQCELLNVPVLIDCAFFGLCGDVHFDFTSPAITDITFSLSKFLPVAHLRIGMRLTKSNCNDLLNVNHTNNYVNKLSAAVGLKLIEEFSPDYNYMSYRHLQEKFCAELNLVPSKSVIFGIDTLNQYPKYNRGYISNRLCFSSNFHEEKLSNSI